MREPLFYRMARPLISFLFRIGFRPTILGREHIPKEGSIIFAGNHTNNFDCLLLISSTKRTIHFLAKDSLMKGFKKYIFKGMGIIPVDRSRKNPESVAQALSYLHQGGTIGIFPEGTINRTEEVTMPFKFGAVKMSRDAGVPIVPFVITGKYRWFHRSIQIEFLKPMMVVQDLEIENEKLRRQISQKLEG